MERVVETAVGENGRYISTVDFYFEGKSHLRVYWSDREDTSFAPVSGWRHGASPDGTQRFEPSTFDVAENGILVGPAALFYNNNLKAFAFEQKLGDDSEIVVLEPFGASQYASLEEFNARVEGDNGYDNT